MIGKSSNYFQNDSNILFIIRELFKDPVIKNNLSNNKNISIVFANIIKCFRSSFKKTNLNFYDGSFNEIFRIIYFYFFNILDALLLLIIEDMDFYQKYMLIMIVMFDANSNIVFSVLLIYPNPLN